MYLTSRSSETSGLINDFGLMLMVDKTEDSVIASNVCLGIKYLLEMPGNSHKDIAMLKCSSKSTEWSAILNSIVSDVYLEELC